VGYLRANTRENAWSEREDVTGGMRKSRDKKFLCDNIHEMTGICRRMEDPRNAHTILIGGFEEQKYKSNTKRMCEHYVKTNLAGNLFSKREATEV